MSHQRENGHVDIANTLIEELMKIHLSGREWQILMVIFRQTWGYCELKNGEKYKDEHGFWVKKKIDRISHTQFEEFTGINRRKIWNILNFLLEKKMIFKTITKNGDVIVCNYGIQKDSNKWRVSPKTVTITKKGDRVSPKTVMGVSPKKGLEVSPKTGHTKEKTKETNTKDNITKEKSTSFIEAWKDFKTMRKKIRKTMTEKAEELIIKKLKKLTGSETVQIAILNQSIMNSWQGIFPLKEDSGEYNDKIMEILNYLNKKTGKNFTIDIPDKIYIITRLKEGRSLETFKKIIDIKCNKWMGKLNKEGDSMEDYLTPKTLFGINFENYLNEPEEDNFAKYLKKEE